MEKKVINDAAVYIVSLAKVTNVTKNGQKKEKERQQVWPENALTLNVIDFPAASDLSALVELSNGRFITINGVSQEVQLSDAACRARTRLAL